MGEKSKCIKDECKRFNNIIQSEHLVPTERKQKT